MNCHIGYLSGTKYTQLRSRMKKKKCTPKNVHLNAVIREGDTAPKEARRPERRWKQYSDWPELHTYCTAHGTF